MSWERKLWEEEQKTQALLEELSYSQEQRRLDELFHGAEALDSDWTAQRQESPAGWLLGSPYHRRLGGQVYALLWFIGLCLLLSIVVFSVRGWVKWQEGNTTKQRIQQYQQQHSGSNLPPASP